MMLRLITISLFALVFLVLPANGQEKRALQHEDVNDWVRIGSTRLSDDGKWVAWVEAPAEGDGVLQISSADGKTTYSFPRGSSPVISTESQFVFFTIVPQADSVRAKKLKKVKASDMPSDTLAILSLKSGSVEKIPNVDSFKTPDEGEGWMAYLLTEEASKKKEEPADSSEASKEEEPSEGNEDEDKDEKKKEKKEGKTLIVKDLNSMMSQEFRDVTSYLFSKNGASLGFLKEDKEGLSDGAFALSKGATGERTLLIGEGNYTGLSLSDAGDRIAFMTNRDNFEADQPAFSLYLDMTGSGEANVVAKEGSPGIAAGWWVSENGSPSFSDSGSRLFFGTSPRPVPDKDDDDILESEKVKVDIWNWKDPLLQPQQVLEANREKNRTYQAVFHLNSSNIVQLATQEIPSVSVSQKRDGKIAFGISNMAYQQEISWEWPRFHDAWLIDVETGNRRQILQAVRDSPRLSPQGKYVTYWDRDSRLWKAINTANDQVTSLSETATYPIYDEIHDWPYEPGNYGQAGWTEGDAEFVFYDDFDIFASTPFGSLRNVTKGYGRKNAVRLRVQNLDFEEPALSASELWMVSGQNMDQMDKGYFSLSPRSGAIQSLVFGSKDFRIFDKADDANVLLFSQSDF